MRPILDPFGGHFLGHFWGPIWGRVFWLIFIDLGGPFQGRFLRVSEHKKRLLARGFNMQNLWKTIGFSILFEG